MAATEWETAWADYINCLRTFDEAWEDRHWQDAPVGWPCFWARARQALREFRQSRDRLRNLDPDHARILGV